MNTMNYHGYTARLAYDERGHIFIGRVLGLRAPISFYAQTVEGLRVQFHAAIDSYLSACLDRGIRPEEPISGRVQLRLAPEMHGAVRVAAQTARKTVNQWVCEVLGQALRG
jgi:predicted HicB family RNase H-like nuclease